MYRLSLGILEGKLHGALDNEVKGLWDHGRREDDIVLEKLFVVEQGGQELQLAPRLVLLDSLEQLDAARRVRSSVLYQRVERRRSTRAQSPPKLAEPVRLVNDSSTHGATHRTRAVRGVSSNKAISPNQLPALRRSMTTSPLPRSTETWHLPSTIT